MATSAYNQCGAARSSVDAGRHVKIRAVGIYFFSSRRRHTRFDCDWSSDVCSSDLWLDHRPLLLNVRLDRVAENADHRRRDLIDGGHLLPRDLPLVDQLSLNRRLTKDRKSVV